jgi:radical SAM superfamily enzyme YgiQ (UPF0313 family)
MTAYTPMDILLVQPVIRHPRDAHLHSPVFNRCFQGMKLLTEETGFLSLVVRGVPSPPTHLLSLAGYLRAQGIRVAVADLNLSYLADAREPEDELRNRLAEHSPRILGISAMESYLMDAVGRLVRTAREADPDLLIVAGGVNATSIDSILLRDLGADAVVRGEGEATLAALCRAVSAQAPLDGIAGLAWRRGEQTVRNPDRPLMDLANLALPARDLYPLAQMYALNGGVDAVYASRGCPHRCLFCHGPAFWRRRWRGRPPDHVARELAWIGAHGARTAFLYDMNFGHDRDWALAVAAGIARQAPDIVWGCELRVEQLLDRSFLEAIQRAGCRSTFVGIESLNTHCLAGVDKAYPAAALDQALENASRVGIGVEATVMIGLPEDSAASIRRTTDAVIRLFREKRLALVHYFLCVPWPGTAIGDHPARHGVQLAAARHAHYVTAPSVPLASTKHLRAGEVFSLWEEGVAQLEDEVRQQIVLRRLRRTFGTASATP